MEKRYAMDCALAMGCNPTGGSINREVIDVVDDENTNLANFHRSGLGQPLSLDATVDIASNRHDRSNLR
jgi:hypothetical protein